MNGLLGHSKRLEFYHSGEGEPAVAFNVGSATKRR